MNVHYKDWYKEVGYQAPTDTQSTNPIPFLTIDNDNNLAFAFNIAITENQQLRSFNENIDSYIQETSLTADSNLLDFANYWLKSALENHGIGAKTAVGYGYMQ
jgi:CRISPR-associated protein Cmr6